MYESFLMKIKTIQGATIKKSGKKNLTQDYVCMRNEYFIYNHFIKIKYKIISKQKRKKNTVQGIGMTQMIE